MIESGSPSLLETLRQLQSKEDIVPEGWKTVEQFAKEFNLSISQTRNLFKIAREKGAVECQKFKIRSGDRFYPVMHYKEKATPIPRQKKPK
jgi:hypothetical protein